MSVTQSIHVEAPVEEVFRFVYDPRTFWSAMRTPTTQVGRPELTDVRLSEEGLGSFYTWTLTLLGRPVDAINVITEFVPDRRFTDRSSRAIVGTWTTIVEPEGNGTRLTLQRHPSSNQVLRAVDRVADRVRVSLTRQTLEQVKARLERPAASAAQPSASGPSSAP